MLDKIKELCRDKGVTILDVQKAVGFNQNALYRWDKSNPGIDKVIIIADYFNVSLDELCGRQSLTAQNDEITRIFNNLNEAGKEDALDYMRYLSERPIYKKCDSVEVVEA